MNILPNAPNIKRRYLDRLYRGGTRGVQVTRAYDLDLRAPDARALLEKARAAR